MSSDFESGSLAQGEVVGDDLVRVQARSDHSPRPLWFYFRVDGAPGPSLTVELANAGQCLGPRYGWNTARPVYRSPGGEWERVAKGRFHETPGGGRRSGQFRFTVPCPTGQLEVAYCYPYTTSDLAAYRRRTPSRVRWETIGRTREGRPLLLASVAGDGGTAPQAWVVARQHAGETPASYALEGMVAWLAAMEPPAPLSLMAVPMLDVDGVVGGRYGKDTAPVDFNRDWCESPVHPELAAIIPRVTPHSLFLDLHASHHGDTSCYLFAAPPGEDSALEARQRRFAELLAEESPPVVGFRAADVRSEPAPPGSARDFHARLGALALCVELSYHLAQSGRYLTPDDYREFGAALARAAIRSVTDASRC